MLDWSRLEKQTYYDSTVFTFLTYYVSLSRLINDNFIFYIFFTIFYFLSPLFCFEGEITVLWGTKNYTYFAINYLGKLWVIDNFIGAFPLWVFLLLMCICSSCFLKPLFGEIWYN